MNQPADTTASAHPIDAAAAATARAQRRVLLAAGALALAGGAGWSAWRLRLQAPADAAASAFWGSSFADLEGAPVAMAGLRGRPLLLNFWATWCPPCVEELPLLNRFHAEQRGSGWGVVGLALDQPQQVRQFLQRIPLDFPVVLGGASGTTLSRALGNEKGGLPFTVLFGSDGGILRRKMGRLTVQDLQDWRQKA